MMRTRAKSYYSQVSGGQGKENSGCVKKLVKNINPEQRITIKLLCFTLAITLASLSVTQLSIKCQSIISNVDSDPLGDGRWQSFGSELEVGTNLASNANGQDDDEDNEIERSVLVGAETDANQEKQQQQLSSSSNDNGGDVNENQNYNENIGELAVAQLLASRRVPSPSNYGEIYLLEDKDYPKSVYENYANFQIGQVSGLATLPNGDVVIFHRGDRHWDSDTFNSTTKQIDSAKTGEDNLIKANTIMIVDRDGRPRKSFGSNLFYMPHSVASDSQANLWVSDVARHQVMRLPALNILRLPDYNESVATTSTSSSSQASTMNLNLSAQVWPDIILGEAFAPGQDENHFCQPSEIAVSSNGKYVYVADGYCNQRVMVFSGTSGKFITSFGQRENMQVVHSLSLIEEKNLLCVASREDGRISFYNAGLESKQTSRLGELVHQLDYPVGRVFSMASISPDYLLVSGNQVPTNRFDLAILNPFTHQLKLVWTSTDLLEPHSLTTTFDRQFAYVADLSKDAYKKVFKYYVIQRKS